MSKPLNRFVVGSLVGNVIEFYDFIIYAYFAKILAKLFFPIEDDFLSLLITFGVFASGYLVRPLGGIWFGKIGDTLGRKKALVTSILTITISTALIGLLPTYDSIGFFAPILLILCRLFQGFAISGEEGGAAIYLSEVLGEQHRGTIGALILSSAYFGIFLGLLAYLLLNTFISHESILAGWWRLPFLLSIPFGIISLIIRVKSIETKEFLVAKEYLSKMHAPFKEITCHHKTNMLVSILLTTGLAIPIYIFTIYLPTFQPLTSEIARITISMGELLLIAFLVPIIGDLSDKYGHEKLLLYSLLLLIFLGYPCFIVLSSNNIFHLLTGELFLALVISMIAAPLFAILISVFPISVRYTGVSVSFNLSMSIFGSTAPMVCIILCEITQHKAAPGFYLTLAGLMSLTAILIKRNKTAAYLSS